MPGGGGDLSCRLGKVLVLGVYTVCFKFQHSISPPGGVGLSDREGGGVCCEIFCLKFISCFDELCGCLAKEIMWNHNCTIVLKAKTEQKLRKILVGPRKRTFLSFEIKTENKFFLHIFIFLALKTIDAQMLF